MRWWSPVRPRAIAWRGPSTTCSSTTPRVNGSPSAPTCSRTAPRRWWSPASSTTPTTPTRPSSATRMRACTSCGRRSRSCGGPDCASPSRTPVVVDDLDVGAVGVEDEGGVVAGVVAGPLAGLAVAPVAGGQGVRIEAVHVLVMAGEGDVEVRGRRPRHERERAPGPTDGEGRALAVLVSEGQSGGRGDDAVERRRRREIRDAQPKVVDDALARERAGVHRLNTVAVGIAQEGAVVVLAVLLARSGGPVVGVPGVDSGLPEGVDLLARGRDERDVQVRRHRMVVGGRGDQEVLPTGQRVRAIGRVDAQWRQDGLEEGLGGGAIGDADGDVVEH